MKLYRTITTLITSMFLCFAFVACEKENANQGDNNGGNNNGPVITDDDTGIELNMSNSGDDKITFTTYYADNNGYVSTTECWMTMTSSNNFVLQSNNSDLINYDIASVGQVSGLSSINNIPNAGWGKQIAVNPGTGYIVRYKGNRFSYIYARIYVEDWIANTVGGIMGVKIIYQDRWGQSDESNSLFGTTWNGYWPVSDGYGNEYSTSITFKFSSTSYTGALTISGIDLNFTYTYGENGFGEMFVAINDGYGNYTTESFQFFVEGNTMTLLYTDSETGETYTVAVLSKQ